MSHVCNCDEPQANSNETSKVNDVSQKIGASKDGKPRVYTKSKASNICRWWVRGKCLYGDQCKLLHPPELFASKTTQQVRQQYIDENNAKNKKLGKGKKKHWGKKKRTMKESMFRQWLLDNFGRELLKSSNYGILDIAGGKGVLSFEFLNLNGIKSTVCDPRQDLNLKRCLRAMRGGYLHRNKLIVDKYVDCTLDQCLQRSDDEIKPNHLRLFFDDKLIHFMDKNENEEDLENLINYQFKQFMKFNKDEIMDMRLLSDTKNVEKSIDSLVKERIRRDCMEMIDLMKNCSVVIGMHPDYATEFIIDFALKHNKPFAVLPCCVFPKSFPHRKLKNGKKVTQYDDFCDYLTQKDTKIKQFTLTLMGGKNKVIYWIPSSLNIDLQLKPNALNLNKSNNHHCQIQTTCQLI